MVDDSAGNHQAGIESSSSNPTKRIPGSIIKPIPEGVEAMGNKMFGGAEVKPRVNCKDTNISIS